MVELYGIGLPVRVLITATLILSLALQSLRLFLLSVHKERRVPVDVLAFETAVLVYISAAIMLVAMTLLQRNLPAAYLSEARYAAALPVLLGTWVAASQRKLEPLFCSLVILPTLPLWPSPFFISHGFVMGSSYLFLRSAIRLDMEWSAITESISRLSIKEAIDLYPGGILFASDKGRTMIINPAMSRLLTTLGMDSMADVPSLWDDLQGIQEDNSVSVTALDKGLLVRLRNAGSWLISRQKIVLRKREYLQILAIDVSEQDLLNIQIEEINRDLERSGKELLDAIGSIDDLEREKQILLMKTRIHDILGHRLSILSRLLEGDQDTVTTISQLKPILTDLSAAISDGANASPIDIMASLSQSFALIGTTIHQTNSLPKTQEVALFFAEVVREASTNAVRHADARNVYVSLDEQMGCYTLTVSNDGLLPDGEIKEGGGLAGMRQRAAALGGALALAVRPNFSIAVKVPKGRGGAEDDQGADRGRSSHNARFPSQPDRRAAGYADGRNNR